MLTDRLIVTALTRPGLALTAAAVSTALGAFASPSAEASGFDHRLVSAEASWVIHVDMENLLKSDIGEFALDRADDFGADNQLKMFEQKTGLNPLEVIEGVTLYGAGEPGEEPVVLLVGSEAILDKLNEFVEADGAPIQRHRALGGVVYEVEDDVYIAVRKGRGDRALYVFSEEGDLLEHAMEVIDGDEPNLSDLDEGRFRRPTHDALVFLTVHGDEFGEMIGDAGPASGLLDGADGLVFELSERGGVLQMVASLGVEDAEAARAAMSMVQGLMMFARGAMQADLEGAEQEQLQMAAELLGALNIRADGRHLTISFEYETERLIELAERFDGRARDVEWDWNGDGDDHDRDDEDDEPEHEWRRNGDDDGHRRGGDA